jgi:hypothetical protein
MCPTDAVRLPIQFGGMMDVVVFMLSSQLVDKAGLSFSGPVSFSLTLMHRQFQL